MPIQYNSISGDPILTVSSWGLNIFGFLVIKKAFFVNLDIFGTAGKQTGAKYPKAFNLEGCSALLSREVSDRRRSHRQ